GGSTQLGGLVADGDALGAHLARIRAVGIAHHAGLRPGLEHLARQPAVLHPRRGRQYHEPRLVRRLELHVPVRVLVAGVADRAGEVEDLARVVATPAVVGEGGGGRQREQRRQEQRRARSHRLSRSLSIGSVRIRLPVSTKIALVTAGATGGTPGSPRPPGAWPESTMMVSTVGASPMR